MALAVRNPALTRPAQDLARRVLLPKAPTKVAEFSSNALPAASQYRASVAWTDRGPVWSDGDGWAGGYPENTINVSHKSGLWIKGETASRAAIIAAIGDQPARLIFEKGYYDFEDARITIPSGCVIEGDPEAIVLGGGFTITPPDDGEEVALTSPPSVAGSLSFDTSLIPDLAVGDELLLVGGLDLFSSEAGDLRMGAPQVGQTQPVYAAEVVVVAEIFPDGVTLAEYLTYPMGCYGTGGGPRTTPTVRKRQWSSFRLDGMHFLGRPSSNYTFRGTRLKNARIKSKISYIEQTGAMVLDTFGYGNRWELDAEQNRQEATSGSGDNHVIIQSGIDTFVVNSDLRGGGQSVDVTYVIDAAGTGIFSLRCGAMNSRFSFCKDGVTDHGGSYLSYWGNLTFLGCETAMRMRSPGATIQGVDITGNGRTGRGIFDQPGWGLSGDGLTIQGARIRKVQNAIEMWRADGDYCPASTQPLRLHATDIDIYDCNRGIWLRGDYSGADAPSAETLRLVHDVAIEAKISNTAIPVKVEDYWNGTRLKTDSEGAPDDAVITVSENVSHLTIEPGTHVNVGPDAVIVKLQGGSDHLTDTTVFPQGDNEAHFGPWGHQTILGTPPSDIFTGVPNPQKLFRSASSMGLLLHHGRQAIKPVSGQVKNPLAILSSVGVDMGGFGLNGELAGSRYTALVADMDGLTGDTRVDILIEGLFGTPAWTPLALGSDLYGWWTADDADSFYDGEWLDQVAGVLLSGNAAYSATAMNGRPAITFDGSQHLRTTAYPSGWPTTGGVEIWVASKQDALVADTTTRVAASLGVGTEGEYRYVGRAVVSGNNRLRAFEGYNTHTDTTGDLSGRHFIGASWADDGLSVTTWFDGVSAGPTTQAFTGTAVANNLTVGARSSSTPSLFWNGAISDVVVTPPLSSTKRAHLIAWGATRIA